MSHLWVADQRTERGSGAASQEWLVAPFHADAFILTPGSAAPLCVRERDESHGAPAVLLCSPSDGQETWVLVGAAQVNGMPLLTGIRVLRDRDELQVGGLRAFFSAEALAAVRPSPAQGERIFCPRCKQEIEKLSPAVRCPQCRVWHHQTAELPCWTYSERCASCNQPTDLNAGYRWTPEGL